MSAIGLHIRELLPDAYDKCDQCVRSPLSKGKLLSTMDFVNLSFETCHWCLPFSFLCINFNLASQDWILLIKSRVYSSLSKGCCHLQYLHRIEL
ncbi:hypothetical protein ACHQM5_020828 [Ranunculus cassubicifolius]